MIYPYQHRQTLCVTTKDPGQTISAPALYSFMFDPLLYIAVVASLPILISIASSGTKGVSVPPHILLSLTTIPFACVGFVAFTALRVALQPRVGDGIDYGETYAKLGAGFAALMYGFSIIPRVMFQLEENVTLWGVCASLFGIILLWLLTLVAYIISFKYIKKPSRFFTWANRCVMIPVFFGASVSTYGVLSGDMWARRLVAPMCVLLVLAVVCLAVELSAQAYKGREVPVWRYKVENMMGASICLMFFADMTFDFLHRFL